jgi:hypothetical protein
VAETVAVVDVVVVVLKCSVAVVVYSSEVEAILVVLESARLGVGVLVKWVVVVVVEAMVGKVVGTVVVVWLWIVLVIQLVRVVVEVAWCVERTMVSLGDTVTV